MKIIYFFWILHGLIYNAQQKKYGCNDITYKGGYFYEIKSGNLANGVLECVEAINNDGYVYRDFAHYKNGVKVGKWLYTEGNDTLQHGEIILDTKLSRLLSQKFSAKHIGLEISHERGLIKFNLKVYEPKKVLGSIEIQNIVNTDLRGFMIVNQVNKVRIFILNSDGYWSDEDFYKLEE
ncbi:hypothetical protein [Flavivirga algicola]|uniref:Uncharacterized protein n=1 Tax=Flavivirga algicola TaxID=2729136 RepID=A0ABX1RWJ7_9FLAO|nr:hypothetical protein [Flavivirga algicola]NMH87941.1 hypothetical protein [Flavivirga algicola]